MFHCVFQFTVRIPNVQHDPWVRYFNPNRAPVAQHTLTYTHTFCLSFFNSLDGEEKEGIVREGIHIDTHARYTRHTRTHRSTSEAPRSVTSDPRCSQNIEHGRFRYG